MYRVKNIHILALLSLPSMENLIHYRRLMWMRKIAVMPLNRNPRKFLNAWISTNRPVGRPNLTTRDSFVKSLQYCNFTCPHGKLNAWVPQANNYSNWKKMTESVRQTQSLTDVEFYKTYL